MKLDIFTTLSTWKLPALPAMQIRFLITVFKRTNHTNAIISYGKKKKKVFGPSEGGKMVSKSFLNVQWFFFHSPRLKLKKKFMSWKRRRGGKSLLFIFPFSFFIPLYPQTADIFNFHPVSFQCIFLASALLTLCTPVLLMALAESTQKICLLGWQSPFAPLAQVTFNPFWGARLTC